MLFINKHRNYADQNLGYLDNLGSTGYLLYTIYSFESTDMFLIKSCNPKSVKIYIELVSPGVGHNSDPLIENCQISESMAKTRPRAKLQYCGAKFFESNEIE